MAVSMTSESWMTVEEAAKQLKVSPYTVRNWLRAQRMKGTQLGGRKSGWRIPESEINRVLREGLGTKGA